MAQPVEEYFEDLKKKKIASLAPNQKVQEGFCFSNCSLRESERLRVIDNEPMESFEEIEDELLNTLGHHFASVKDTRRHLLCVGIFVEDDEGYASTSLGEVELQVTHCGHRVDCEWFVKDGETQ